jgi:hypothetical protein
LRGHEQEHEQEQKELPFEVELLPWKQTKEAGLRQRERERRQ